MKKLSIAVLLLFAFFATSLAVAEPVRDWKDLHRIHEQLKRAIAEMERARAANHYDMEGHGAKAEELMRQAEHELHEAVEASKKAK
jgi:hypothetical protein